MQGLPEATFPKNMPKLMFSHINVPKWNLPKKGKEFSFVQSYSCPTTRGTKTGCVGWAGQFGECNFFEVPEIGLVDHLVTVTKTNGDPSRG